MKDQDKTKEQLIAELEEKRNRISQLEQLQSALKLTEKSPLDSEEKLNALYISMSEMVVFHELVYDKKGKPVNYKIIDCNDAFIKTTGLVKKEIIGKLATEVYKTQKAPYWDEYISVATSGEPMKFTTFYEDMEKHFSISVVGLRLGEFATITTDITEKRKTEEILSKSEEQLRFAMEATDDGIWDWFVKKDVLYWSPRAFKMLGYDEDEFILTVKKWEELVHPDDLPVIWEALGRILAKKETNFQMEFRYLTKSGNWIWVVGRGKPVEFDAKGNVTRMVGTHFDITDRKIAEEHLKASEEKFRKTFLISPDSININRLSDGVYISINNGFTKIMGYTEEEIIGKSSLEFNVWNNPEDRIKLVKELLTNGYCHNLEAEFKAKDGSLKYGLMSASVFELEGEKCIISITRDITERKNVQEELQKSEERYRNFFENDITGDYLSTSEGKLLDCNKAFAKILGYDSVEEIMKINTEKLYPSINDRAEFLRKLTNDKFLADSEFILVAKNGEIKYCIENVFGYFDENGELTKFQGYVFDITARKHAEKQLQINALQFKLITQTSVEGFWEVGVDGKIMFANEAYCRISGYTLDELKELSISDLDFEEQKQDTQIRINFIIKKGYAKFEARHKTKEGRIIDFEVNTTYSPELQKILAFFNDITERKSSEKKLLAQLRDIERFNRLMVGRETKMIELKKEINELLVKNNQNPKYKIVE